MADAHETESVAGPETRQAARDATQALKQEGQRLAADLKAKADSLASEQKTAAKSYLSDISQAVDSMSSTLDDQGHDAIAGYAKSAAEEMRRMGHAIEARDYTDLAREVGEFARRRPVVFFTGAFVIGFGLARFLSTSKPADEREPISPHPLTTGSAAPAPTYGEDVISHG
jgi:gas vesicle protein